MSIGPLNALRCSWYLRRRFGTTHMEEGFKLPDMATYSTSVKRQRASKRPKNPYLHQLRALPKLSEVEYRYNAVSFFCGGGGLDLGAALAGFNVLFASDIEQKHATRSLSTSRTARLSQSISMISQEIRLGNLQGLLSLICWQVDLLASRSASLESGIHLKIPAENWSTSMLDSRRVKA